MVRTQVLTTYNVQGLHHKKKICTKTVELVYVKIQLFIGILIIVTILLFESRKKIKLKT